MKTTILVIILLINLSCIKLAFTQTLPTSKVAISFCFEEWLPFSYSDHKNNITGIDIILLKTLLSEKYDLTFNELPFRRCLRSVQKGLFDFILHVDKSDNLILIEFPLNTWQLTFAVKMESTQSVKQIINNQALTLLIADDYQYPEEINLMLNDFSGKITKRSFYTSDKNSIITLFMLLEKGLVDVILIDKIWAEEQINKHQIQVKLLAEIIHSEPQFIGYQDGNLAPIANDIFHLLSNKKE